MNREKDHTSLHTQIQKTHFSCHRCGTCCRETEPGSNIVMVSPGEVRVIMKRTGLLFDDLAEPYPDTIREGEREYTFGWAIRRRDDRCIFLENNCCSIYDVRPWICRTYPFMLENGSLSVYPCAGITPEPSGRMNHETAERITSDLESRQTAEYEEEEQIRKVFSHAEIPPGKRVVIDGEGIRILHSLTR